MKNECCEWKILKVIIRIIRIKIRSIRIIVMKKENWFLTGLTLAVLFLFFFYPSLSWKIQTFFSSTKSPQSGEYQRIVLENESLNAEVAGLRQIKKNPPAVSLLNPPAKNDNLLPVFVYSRYPFNFKNELLVNAGADQGIEIGRAAVIAPDNGSSSNPVRDYISNTANPILVGKIEKVFENVSLVQTIFDSRFQSAVRIGKSGTNALLKGGNEPELALIPKDAKIANGDVIYSASPNFPYGLAIGNVSNVRISSGQLFQEADVEANYNPNELQSLLITTNHYGAK